METRLRFVSPPGACAYLPAQTWQLQYEVVRHLEPDEYLERLQQGWRRIGHAMFRPVCPSCRLCQSLRIPVDTLHPDRSQRRAWKASCGEVSVMVGSPVLSHDRLELYRKFHAHQTDTKAWPTPGEDDLLALIDNPIPTEEWSYRVGNRLVGVGYVDRVADGLSAIYFYYDPDERDRSLGTFNVLSVLAAANDARLPYVYLGYYIASYPSLAYKARFRPNEVLGPDGRWARFLE